ncbi:hypothetical protein NQ317_007019 [Molorchus minor]|uniref:Uncharacterized protein n=1 Tax=Molorchus minor TaxID=1323400 RepID=A0ABQ9JTX0_9CUCU|nr:hypothetical protein NQ317_007019 [Molorchus minor]
MLKIPARFKQCDLSVSLAFDYCDCIVNMGTRAAACLFMTLGFVNKLDTAALGLALIFFFVIQIDPLGYGIKRVPILVLRLLKTRKCYVPRYPQKLATFTVTAKIRSLYDYQLRLMQGVMPPPSGVDIANTIKYFSQTLLTVLKDVPSSPLDLLKNPEMDAERMGLFP